MKFRLTPVLNGMQVKFYAGLICIIDFLNVKCMDNGGSCSGIDLCLYSFNAEFGKANPFTPANERPFFFSNFHDGSSRLTDQRIGKAAIVRERPRTAHHIKGFHVVKDISQLEHLLAQLP